MDMTEKTLDLLGKLNRMKSYKNGMTGGVRSHNLYAVVDFNGQEHVCTIPPNGGKPIVIMRSKDTPYPVSHTTIPCYTPRLNVPGVNSIREMEWINLVNKDKCRDIKFKALINIATDSITPITST